MKNKNKKLQVQQNVPLQEFWRTVSAINDQIIDARELGDDARFSVTVKDPTGNKRKQSYTVRLKNIFTSKTH